MHSGEHVVNCPFDTLWNYKVRLPDTSCFQDNRMLKNYIPDIPTGQKDLRNDWMQKSCVVSSFGHLIMKDFTVVGGRRWFFFYLDPKQFLLQFKYSVRSFCPLKQLLYSTLHPSTQADTFIQGRSKAERPQSWMLTNSTDYKMICVSHCYTDLLLDQRCPWNSSWWCWQCTAVA